MNMITKEVEKFTKYEDLTSEMELICNIQSKSISIILGANGTMSKSFRQYASNVYLESRKTRNSI